MIETIGVGREMTFDEKLDNARVQLKEIGANVLELEKEYDREEPSEGQNVREVFANLKLSYRHIEDASMRIGKVKQALNDGESIYDKNVVGSK